MDKIGGFMEYFVFKLNLEPKTLQIYDYKSNREQVIAKIIPKGLGEIFSTYEIIDDSLIKYSDKIDISEVVNSFEYSKLIELNRNIIKMYAEIVNRFESGEGINYSVEYLEHRELLKNYINDLLLKFPFLKGALESKENVFIIDSFSKIKMAVTYIQRAKKIEHFIKQFPKNESKSEFIYDKRKEFIYISTKDATRKSVEDYVEILQDKINNFSSVSNIGRVTINPVYEKFEFTGLYSEITIELVYPNGDPARDRSRAIEAASAAREIRKLEASKNEKIDISKLNDYYQEDAEKGYIKSITSKGKKIITSVIKKIVL
jgi:hypothetical protein